MRFDWGAMMRAGFTRGGLTPDQFWALTPAELQLVLGEPPGVRPMGRAGLTALLARFPDDEGGS